MASKEANWRELLTTQVSVDAEVTLEEIADSLALMLTDDQIVAFFELVDATVGDCEFTRKVVRRFSQLVVDECRFEE